MGVYDTAIAQLTPRRFCESAALIRPIIYSQRRSGSIFKKLCFVFYNSYFFGNEMLNLLKKALHKADIMI